MTSRHFPAIAVLAAAVLAVACGGTSPPESPTSTASEARALATSPAPIASPTLEIQLPADWPISTTGPWLVYRNEGGFVVANPDGSGRMLLFDGASLGADYLYDFETVASASGGWIALYTFDDPETMTGPSLQLVHVPDGIVRWSTRLLSKEIEADLAGGAEAGSPASEAAQAVTMQGSLAWSPDGQKLAFVAALNGPSSDLYVYDLRRGRLQRITSGPNQMASLSWSPDGQWIAHQAVESFGTGAGWTMGAVWVVSPDGRQLNKLYAPNSGGEVFVGWSRGDSLISYSFGGDGFHDIRAAGADGAVENILIPSYLSDAAYDPASGTISYAVSQGMSYIGAEVGAFLWSPVGSGSNRVDAGNWDTVQWSEAAGRFYFEGLSGVMGVTPSGESVTVPVVDQVSVSPDGRYVALWGNGYSDRQSGIYIYTSDLEIVVTLDEFDVPFVLWRPDSAGLMAIGEAGLTYYPLEGQALIVDPSAMASFEGGLGWVLP
jgi:WD40 repeat protein